MTATNQVAFGLLVLLAAGALVVHLRAVIKSEDDL